MVMLKGIYELKITNIFIENHMHFSIKIDSFEKGDFLIK